MAEIEKFIVQLDQNPTAGNEVKIYKVKNTSYEGSAAVARNLCTILGIPDSSSRYGPSANTKSPIKIMGDYGSNVLVVGGSLGAQALNEALPQALARLSEQERPDVLHQTGKKQLLPP